MVVLSGAYYVSVAVLIVNRDVVVFVGVALVAVVDSAAIFTRATLLVVEDTVIIGECLVIVQSSCRTCVSYRENVVIAWAATLAVIVFVVVVIRVFLEIVGELVVLYGDSVFVI